MQRFSVIARKVKKQANHKKGGNDVQANNDNRDQLLKIISKLHYKKQYVTFIIWIILILVKMLESLKDAQILIVEDTPYNIDLIANTLKSKGYQNIRSVKTGTEALNIIENEHIDLILLDLLLPDMSGLVVCKQLNESYKDRNISVIVQSGVYSDHEKQVAFELGVNDFISKPLDKTDLLARTANQLKQRQLIQNLEHARASAESELEAAFKVMNSILPNEKFVSDMASKHCLSIATVYSPSSKLGGDFYELVEYGDGKLGIYFWDFSGHGIAAAINTFRLHSIINYDKNHMFRTAGSFLSHINTILFEMLERQYFTTMFYGILDTRHQVLEFAGAAAAQPIIISLRHKKYMFLDTKEFPLGTVSSHNYQSKGVDLHDWDVLILYSNALTETSDDKGVFLNIEEVAHDIANNSQQGESAEAIKEKIMKRFGKSRVDNLKDDLTLNIFIFNVYNK